MEFLLGMFAGALILAIIFAVWNKQIKTDLALALAKVKALEAKVVAYEKAIKAKAQAIKTVL